MFNLIRLPQWKKLVWFVTGWRDSGRHAPAEANPAPVTEPAWPAGDRATDIDDHNQWELRLPLADILPGFSPELRERLLHPDVTNVMVPVPLGLILPQLVRGIVKIAFGDLRRAVPHMFLTQDDLDSQSVTLPLAAILSILDPSMLPHRPPARPPVVTPGDAAFDLRNLGLVISAGNSKPVAAAPPPVPARKPRAMGVPTPIPEYSTSSPPAANTPTSCPADLSPANPPHHPTPVPVEREKEPAIPTAALRTPDSETASDFLIIALSVVSLDWPEPVRQEIIRLNLSGAKVALPLRPVEEGLRQGRLVFTWKALRSWMRPAVTSSESPHGEVLLKLPLNVVAPLFLTQRSSPKAAKTRVVVDNNIPDLFSGFPAAAPKPPAAAPAAVPVEAAPQMSAKSSVPPIPDHSPEPASEIEDHLFAVSKFATNSGSPQAIVFRSAALEGVAGTLVALPEGLLVASRLPPDVKGEALAAFLPQIFGKMSQSISQLGMGEISRLDFIATGVPWEIHRINGVLFAAFGRAGGHLPTTELAALAAELGNHG